MTALRRTIFAAAVTLLLACGGNSTGPTAGALTVSLTTPNPGQDRDRQLLGKLGMRLREQPAAAAMERGASLAPSAR